MQVGVWVVVWVRVCVGKGEGVGVEDWDWGEGSWACIWAVCMRVSARLCVYVCVCLCVRTRPSLCVYQCVSVRVTHAHTLLSSLIIQNMFMVPLQPNFVFKKFGWFIRFEGLIDS